MRFNARLEWFKRREKVCIKPRTSCSCIGQVLLVAVVVVVVVVVFVVAVAAAVALVQHALSAGKNARAQW